MLKKCLSSFRILATQFRAEESSTQKCLSVPCQLLTHKITVVYPPLLQLWIVTSVVFADDPHLTRGQRNCGSRAVPRMVHLA